MQVQTAYRVRLGLERSWKEDPILFELRHVLDGKFEFVRESCTQAPMLYGIRVILISELR